MKSAMMKRVSFYTGTALILTAGILLSAACKRGAAVDKSDPQYPITLSVFSMAAMPQPPADNKIYQWIKTNLNVTFSWDILVGDMGQKIGVMIAGGDYPDLLHVGDARFYRAGALIPLDSLIEQYAPRLKKHYGPVWERLKEDDGHIYVLPVWGIVTGRDQGTWYGGPALWTQKEILKEFGYPKIKTMDEYFDLLIRYKEKHPTIDGQPTVGFTILTHAWRNFNLINPPNFLAGYPNDGRGTVDPVTHEYKVFLYQDISKRWFKKLNDMNAIGLVDRACFVETYDQYLAKISSCRVLGFHDQMWQFLQADDSLKTQGMANRTYTPLPIVFDESIRPHYRTLSVPNYGQGIGISVKAKDPVRIIRFLDAQLAEEVQRVISWGIEGEDYQYDENGHPYRTREQWQQQEDDVWKLHNKAALWRNHNPKIEGSFSDGFPSNIDDLFSERERLMRPEDRELWQAYGVTNNNELMDPDPPENSVWFPAFQLQDADDDMEINLIWQRVESTYIK
jgi:putative aldouronate transport system substrate-binding protein